MIGCGEVLGWDSLDMEKLEDVMEEFGLDISEVTDETENTFGETTDINAYIHSALYLGSEKIKEALKEDYPEYEDIIDDFEANIYANYLDSGFDSAFGNYDYDDLSGFDMHGYLEDLMNELLELAGEPKIGEEDEDEEEEEDDDEDDEDEEDEDEEDEDEE